MGMYKRKRIENITNNEWAAVAAKCGKCKGGISWTELEDAHASLLSKNKLSALHIYL